MDNGDKFGYDEMKSAFDQNASEREELNRAYENWEYNNIRLETRKARENSLNDLKSKYNTPEEPKRQKPISVESMLDSLKDRETREKHNKENEELDREREKIEKEIANRNIKAYGEIRSQYVLCQKEPTKTSSKEIDQDKIELTKTLAKKIIVAVATGLIAAGTIIGGISVLKNPDPYVPEQTPQSTEMQEELENAKDVDEVIDVINENKKQQIENGVTTHPEHVVDDSEQTVEEPKEETSMSDSMQEFVEEAKRQKVINIESGITMHPEHVVDDSVGGRGL